MDLSAVPSEIYVLVGILGLTELLRRLRAAREEGSKLVLGSDAFRAWEDKHKDLIATEAEKTRDLVRDVRDELLREIAHVADTHATRAEVERWKGRTRTLEALTSEHHGAHFPGDSSTFEPGTP